MDLKSIDGVAKAIHHNLSYLQTVAITDLLAESCFRNPAIEYLERKAGIPFISMEYRHPVFKSKRIDLAWTGGVIKSDDRSVDTTTNNTKREGTLEPDSFLEMKYVKSETANGSEIQRYFNDILRLAILCSDYDVYSNKDFRCFFIASGSGLNWQTCFQSFVNSERSDVITPIASGQSRPLEVIESEYNNWFSFDINNPIKQIDTKNHKKRFDFFSDDYVLRSTKKHPTKDIVFYTQLLWIEDTKEELLDRTVTGLWRVYV